MVLIMSESDRIKLIIRHLIGKGIASNQKGIGELLGYKNESSFSQVVNGKVPTPSNLLKKIKNLDKQINEEWLLTGEGEMLKTDTPKSGVSSEEGGVISIPRDAWEVIRNQSASLKAKDEQLGMLAASLKAKDDQINTLISQSKSEREETVQALKNTISTLEKELAKKGEDAGYPSHVAIRADTE